METAFLIWASVVAIDVALLIGFDVLHEKFWWLDFAEHALKACKLMVLVLAVIGLLMTSVFCIVAAFQ